jgi:hypothetical protein
MPIVLVAACSTAPSPVPKEERAAITLNAPEARQSNDDRAAFSNLFCRVLRVRPYLPEAGADPIGDCGRFLHRAVGDAEELDAVVPLEPLEGSWRLLIVPGFGADCYADFIRVLSDARPRLEDLGVATGEIQVSGLSSSTYNAPTIRSAVMSTARVPGERLVLLGYSKGTADILHALTAYPEVAERVYAVVSLAGSVGGSPLLESTGLVSDIFAAIHWIWCFVGDNRALESMIPERRDNWLKRNPLPASVRYYSLVSFAERRHISAVLLPGYDTLSGIDEHNDSQLLYADQIIPGGTLLAYLRADHWAVALPFSTEHPFLASTLVDENAFPREALLEAILRYLDATENHPDSSRSHRIADDILATSNSDR